MIRALTLALLLTACDPPPVKPAPTDAQILADLQREWTETATDFTARYHAGMTDEAWHQGLAADRLALEAVVEAEHELKHGDKAAFDVWVAKARPALKQYRNAGAAP